MAAVPLDYLIEAHEWMKSESNRAKFTGRSQEERELMVAKAIGYTNSDGKQSFPYNRIQDIARKCNYVLAAPLRNRNSAGVTKQYFSRLAVVVFKLSKEIGSEALIREAEELIKLGEER